MHIPKTYLSLHDVTGLQVHAGQSLERPLILTVDGAHGAMEITLFLQPLLTEAQIEKLVLAMRAAMTTAEPAAVGPHETAAYKAHDDYFDDYFDRLRADLDRHPIEGTRR